MSYRPEVDGLRAVAVVAVILFHLGVPGFSGGFVGVDVFFVISGYLITRLIRDEVVSTGHFRFANFYVRRARRLLPALLFSILFTIAGAFLLFSASDLKRFGLESASAVVSGSNFFFWRESGYFSVDGRYKPLLHTWSLSVEEQFYLLWPATLMLLLHLRSNVVAVGGLMALGLTSLALNFIYASEPATIFYLTPFRVFEFCIGALLVWGQRFQTSHSKITLDAMLLSGLGAIGWSIAVFTEATHFPSYNAFVPCTGAALAIYGGAAPRAGALLRNSPMVAIGLISYSLYLIHWPLIVLYEYYSFRWLNGIDMGMLFAAAVLMAMAMYKFIERPFRHAPSEERNDKAFVVIGGLLAVSAAGTGLLLYLLSGLPQRIPGDLEVSRWKISKSLKVSTDEISERLIAIGTGWRSHVIKSPRLNSRRILMIGDSHVRPMYRFASLLAEKYGYDVYLHWQPGYLAVVDTFSLGPGRLGTLYPKEGDGGKRSDAYWQYVKELRFDYIIAVNRWTFYAEGDYGDVKMRRRYLLDRGRIIHDRDAAYMFLDEKIRASTEFLLGLAPSVVYLMEVPPTLRSLHNCDDVPTYLIRWDSMPERCRGAPRTLAYQRMSRMEELFAAIRRENSVHVIDTLERFCPSRGGEHCIGFHRGVKLYKDFTHLNDHGVQYFLDTAKQEIEDIFGKPPLAEMMDPI